MGSRGEKLVLRTLDRRQTRRQSHRTQNFRVTYQRNHVNEILVHLGGDEQRLFDEWKPRSSQRP